MKNKRRIFKGRRLGGLIDEVELQWKLRVSSKVAAREVGKEAARFRGEIRIFPKISIYRFPIRLEGKIV